MFNCQICGKEYKSINGLTSHLKKHNISSKNYYLEYIGKQKYCLKCGKPTNFISLNKGFQEFCSQKCAINSKEVKKRREKTIKEKYGVENVFQLDEIKEKSKQTILKQYGVENYSQTKEYRKKYNNTCLEKYGKEYYVQTDEFKEKSKETWFDKYGVENPTQSDEIKEKSKLSSLIKYGTEYPNQNVKVKEKIKKTILKKYGVTCYTKHDKYNKKRKETCLEKYGASHHLKSEEIKEKQKNTNLERYGVEYLMQSIEIKEKSKHTCLEKYGVENISQLDEIKDKVKKTHFKFFYNKLINSDRLKEKVKPNFKLDEYNGVQKSHSWICCKCNNEFKDHLNNGKIPRCPTCYPPLTGTSLSEKEVSDFCKQYYSDLIENSRSIIPPLELDIYIPEKKLAIEFDGLYWHSEINGNKDPNYHLNKTLQCEKKGIQLIHIFEDEWLNKQDIVESIIKSKLGIYEQKIYARKTEFKSVSQDESDDFLFDNHLQGSIRGQNFGLYYDAKLVSLLVTGTPRYNKEYDYELYRFCNKKNIQVIGGLSKLIKNFKKSHTGSIISYCDRRYSNGNGYTTAGFEQINRTNPSYFYIKNFDRYNRMKFQKHKLVDKLPIFDSNLTEWQNMQLNEYDRVFDCGNFVFQY
jgi:predicted nucleic acid-binding Zn ribbon protein